MVSTTAYQYVLICSTSFQILPFFHDTVGRKTRFYSDVNNRAYGPKTVHAESTLKFVSPSDYKAKMRSRSRSKSPQRPLATNQPSVPVTVIPPAPHVQYSSHGERMKRSLSPPTNEILPMTIIDQPFSVAV